MSSVLDSDLLCVFSVSECVMLLVNVLCSMKLSVLSWGSM